MRAATRAPGQGLRRAARDRHELHARGARRRRRRRHARARAPARPAGHRAPRSWRRRSPAPRSAGPSRRRRRRRRSPRPRPRCAPTAARSRPTPSRRSPMTISSAARAAAGGWAPAGDVTLPATVTLVQQLHLSPLPDGSAVLLFLGQGPAAGDVPRPYAAAALGRRASGARPSRSIRAPSWPASDLGLAVDAAGNAYAVWSVSDGRVRTSLLPAGGAFSAALTTAATGRTPRVAVAAAGRRRAARPGSTCPAAARCCAPRSGRPAGLAHRRAHAAAGRRDDAREPRARRLDGRVGDRHRDDRHGRRADARASTCSSDRPPRRRGRRRTCAPGWPSRSARRSSRWARSARSRCGSRAT